VGAVGGNVVPVYSELHPYLGVKLKELVSTGEGSLPTITHAQLTEMLSPGDREVLQGHIQKLQRSISCAAASCIVAHNSPTKLNAIIRAVMEVVKTDDSLDQGRQDLAAETLISLLSRLTSASAQKTDAESARASNTCNKIITNICLLSCAKKDQAPATAKAAAREVLKKLSVAFGPDLFHRLPSLWDIVAVAGSNEGKGQINVEGALRVTIVLAPQLQGPSLSKALELDGNLLSRVTNPTTPKILMALSARLLALLVRKEGQEIDDIAWKGISVVGRRLAAALADEGQLDESIRISCAKCLLEVTKGVIVDGWGARAKLSLPFLLPVALRTLSDQVLEVRNIFAPSYLSSYLIPCPSFA